MLSISSVGELASILHLPPRHLFDVGDHIDDYVQLYELHDPAAPKRKVRTVICPTGALRRIQVTLLRSLFRRRLHPTPYSFGGIPGRNPVQNASKHIGSQFAYTTDIEDFFPSISAWTLREMFEHRLGCSAEVSTLLTRLCTYAGHVAQGLVTSPALADQALRRVDHRIAGVSQSHGLIYTRFLDDITVSGCFALGLGDSGIVRLVRTIIDESGFKVAQHKEQSGRLEGDNLAITGLRYLHGHLDVVAEYIQRLDEQLAQHRALSRGEEFTGILFTGDQLRGRVEYVCAINHRRRRSLRQEFSSIDWDAVGRHATERGLIVCRRKLRRIDSAASVSGNFRHATGVPPADFQPPAGGCD